MEPYEKSRHEVIKQRITKNLSELTSTGQYDENRFEQELIYYLEKLDITEENMTAAYSRIMDVDMAEEMTKYSTYTVMTQAGTSVLAQANDRPSTVLQMLE